MQRQESHIDPFDLKPFHQVLAEMQSCGRRGDGALVPGENGLVPLVVDRLDFRPDPFGQRGFPHLIKSGFELVVITVEQETKRPAARSSVVDHLGHQQVVISEIKFVADADFTGRIDQYIPKAQVAVQFAQQENFDFGAGLLLVTVKTGRKDFRIVEGQHIPFIEIIDHIFKNGVFDLAAGPVDHHQSRFVAVFGRIFGQHVRGKAVIVLRKFHRYWKILKVCRQVNGLQSVIRQFLPEAFLNRNK